jgi:hypothetical protein
MSCPLFRLTALLGGHFSMTEMAPDVGEYEGVCPLILKSVLKMKRLRST